MSLSFTEKLRLISERYDQCIDSGLEFSHTTLSESDGKLEEDLSRIYLNFPVVSKALKYSLGKLPDELEKCQESFYESFAKRMFEPTDNLDVLLRRGFDSSFVLPPELENFDLWSKVSEKLDQQYHSQLWTEAPEFSDCEVKEKYIIGLCEYIDGECSLEKSQLITEHLLECSSCRENYLGMIKLKKALNYSYSLDSSNSSFNNSLDDENVFWSKLESKLFPDAGLSDNMPKKKMA